MAGLAIGTHWVNDSQQRESAVGSHPTLTNQPSRSCQSTACLLRRRHTSRVYCKAAVIAATVGREHHCGLERRLEERTKSMRSMMVYGGPAHMPVCMQIQMSTCTIVFAYTVKHQLYQRSAVTRRASTSNLGTYVHSRVCACMRVFVRAFMRWCSVCACVRACDCACMRAGGRAGLRACVHEGGLAVTRPDCAQPRISRQLPHRTAIYWSECAPIVSRSIYVVAHRLHLHIGCTPHPLSLQFRPPTKARIHEG